MSEREPQPDSRHPQSGEARSECGSAAPSRSESAADECAELREAIRLALAGIPDAMHPGIPPQFVDDLVHVQIVLRAAIGDDDPGDVKAAQAALTWKAA